MGTVHAKEREPSLDADLKMAEVEEVTEESVQKKAMEKANKILSKKIVIDKVHFEGLRRTKNDFLVDKVERVFDATTLPEVMAYAHQARGRLEGLGVFNEVEIYVDVSRGEKRSPNGLEVYFLVEEKGLVGGNAWVQAGSNEGFMVLGTDLNNVNGRGEILRSKVSYSTLNNMEIKSYFRKALFGNVERCWTVGVSRQDEDFPQSSFKDQSKGLFTSLDFLSPLGKHELKWEGTWRELHSVPPQGSFSVREESGHSLKSAVKHVLVRDERDHVLLPTNGHLLKLTAEYAGLGGDTQFLKQNVDLQMHKSIFSDIVLSGSFQGGLVKSLNNRNVRIQDRFFLGGPLSVRGFYLRGIAPREDGASLGAEAYWAGGLHVHTPLPFRPGKGGFGELFRTHFFLTAGNLFTPDFSNGDWRGQLGMLRNNMRWSYGAGVAMLLGPAKLEINYCIPMNVQKDDSSSPGLQVGVGLEFL